MSQRAASLADQFERINAALIAAVQACSETDWASTCEGERWPVGVTAHHVAVSYPAFKDLVLGIANGAELPPITPEMLDGFNRQHAVDAAHCTRAETLDLLRHDGNAAADAVRALSDTQLDRTAAMALTGDAPVSAQRMVEFMIDHPTDHLASIRTAIGKAPARVV
jgi:hypothetical protein